MKGVFSTNMQWIYLSLCFLIRINISRTADYGDDIEYYPDYGNDDPCTEGITINDISGVIEPFGYPSPYENSLNCSWSIEASVGTRIAVKFSPVFSVEADPSGSCIDFVSFLDGSETLKMCGTDTPSSYLSSSNVLDVNFITNEEGIREGFSFNWTAIDATTIPTPVYMNTSNEETISSPGFPNSYGNLENYTWAITVAATKFLLIEFDERFGLESGDKSGCPYDAFTIYNGTAETVSLMKICTKPSVPIVLKTNNVVTKFTSDSTVTGLGFSFSFKAVEPVNCQVANLVNGQMGVVSSPYFPIPYENNLSCEWRIVVSTKQRVAVRFNEPFHIKYDGSCATDYLRIFDGSSASSKQILEDFCGDNTPRGFLSTTNELTVVFSSGTLGGNAAGFSFNWTAEDTCASGFFQCWDGTCVNETYECNGIVDCPNDIADEAECASNTQESDCGTQEIPPEFYWEHRIVGGSEAKQGSWPWQVSVLLSGHPTCGGVLVSLNWVMTAAHCILKGPNIIVVLGDYNISNVDAEREQRIVVDDIFVHPDYDSHKSQGYLNGSDIAMVHLSTPAKNTTWVRPICLPSKTPNAGETLVVTGWGRTSLTSLDQTEVLRQVRLSTLTSTECSKSFSSLSSAALPDGVLCASGGGPGMGACRGDSGGPAMSLRNGKWEVIGIVSYSHQCGTEGLPIYFTDVSSYLAYVSKYSEQVMPPKQDEFSLVIHDDVGRITVPESEGDKYQQNVLYRWFIIVAENKRITVKFSDVFNVEFGTTVCPYDYLLVYDGPDTASPKYLNKKFCGSLAPPDFESTTNSIIVEFSSDGSYEEKGFSLQWYTSEGCAENEFRCWNQTCIPSNRKCDGNLDCIDGADEIQCKLPVGSECGVPDVEPTIPWFPLIVNGHNAVEGSWPWQVALLDDSGVFVCGGTLIDSQWVMTAAQCIDSSKNYTVFLGDYDLEYMSLYERKIGVKAASVHPGYITTGSDDIAMLDLTEEATFSKWIKPICLPELNGENLLVGSTCILTGWGSTAELAGRSAYSRILQQATLTVFSDSACIGAYRQIQPTHSSETLPGNIICAGHQQKRVGACHKDTGGPLQCLVNGAWQQYGIFSFAKTCGDFMFFERVSSYRSWIDGNIARSQCEQRQVQEGTSGIVQSPLIHGKYPTNVHCSWIIRVPEGKLLNIKFEYFDIEDQLLCEWDNFTMHDGKSENARKFLDETLCGRNRSIPELVSTSNEILIVFKTDASESYRGFKLHYTTIERCKGNQFQCWDNSCIDPSKKCDGRADCPYQKDEMECPHPDGFCGVQHVAPVFMWDARIYGGAYAEKGSWPWQVYIIGAGMYQCGASLVHEEWVLTAAHCTYFSLLYVGIGGHNLTDNANDQIIRVDASDMHRHEKFVRANIQFGYDIALLRLRKKVVYGTYVQSVCMTTPEDKPISPEANCFVTGWGMTKYNGISSQVLRQVHLPVLSDEQCKKTNGEPYYEDRVFCAGDYTSGGLDSCRGDSGGPLVCFENNHWYQYGIVSYGSDGAHCGRPGQAGFYTRISFHESWIQNVTNNTLPFVPPVIATTDSLPTTTQVTSSTLFPSVITTADSLPTNSKEDTTVYFSTLGLVTDGATENETTTLFPSVITTADSLPTNSKEDTTVHFSTVGLVTDGDTENETSSYTLADKETTGAASRTNHSSSFLFVIFVLYYFLTMPR